MTTTTSDTSLWWPQYRSPADLAAIEEVPLADRGLPTTTYELLRHAVDLRPEGPAVIVMPDAARWQEPISRTFADLLADVHRIANALHARGVRRDDVVTLMAPNCADLIPAMLGAQLAGVAAPVNGALVPEHVASLLERSGSRVVIAAPPELDEGVWRTVTLLVETGRVDTVLVLRPTGVETVSVPELRGARVEMLAEVAAHERADHFVGIAPGGSDLAALFHTGGTTGLPKLAAHTHTNEVSDAWMLAANDILDEDSRIFAGLPLFHVNALIVTMLAPLFRAQTAVWAGPLGYRDIDLYGCFWKLVERHRITTMSAVPTVYAVLAQIPVDADVSSLKLAMVGASALPAAVRADFEAHTGVPLLEGYGLTEATCASVRSFTDAPRPGSVGQRLPYQSVKAVRRGDDGSWTDLPAGDKGNVAIAGPTVFAGYVTGRRDGALMLDPLGSMLDGWVDTGDLGWVDDDGFVHLTGRAKDLIIRGGHNIDPSVVEDVLLAHPAVTAAGVVGEPDEHAGEVPVAFVTITAGAETTEEQLTAWAAERVSERAAAPRRTTIVDALPVTDVGKPYKLELRARAAQRVVAERLEGVDGASDVAATVEGGAVVVIVAVRPDQDEAVRRELDRFALDYRLEAGS